MTNKMLASMRNQALMYTVEHPDRNDLKILWHRPKKGATNTHKSLDVPDILNKLGEKCNAGEVWYVYLRVSAEVKPCLDT